MTKVAPSFVVIWMFVDSTIYKVITMVAPCFVTLSTFWWGSTAGSSKGSRKTGTWINSSQVTSLMIIMTFRKMRITNTLSMMANFSIFFLFVAIEMDERVTDNEGKWTPLLKYQHPVWDGRYNDYEWKWLWTVTTRWSSPRWAGVPHRTSPSRRALIGTRFSSSSSSSSSNTSNTTFSSSCTCSFRGRFVTFAFRAVHLLLAVLALRWGSTEVKMNVEVEFAIMTVFSSTLAIIMFIIDTCKCHQSRLKSKIQK